MRSTVDFAHAATAIEDKPGTAGAEHDLLLELADDPIAGHERLLLAIHRVSGAETWGVGSRCDDGLQPPGAGGRRSQANGPRRRELRGQRLVEPAHAVLKILNLGAEQLRQRLAEEPAA